MSHTSLGPTTKPIQMPAAHCSSFLALLSRAMSRPPKSATGRSDRLPATRSHEVRSSHPTWYLWWGGAAWRKIHINTGGLPGILSPIRFQSAPCVVLKRPFCRLNEALSQTIGPRLILKRLFRHGGVAHLMHLTFPANDLIAGSLSDLKLSKGGSYSRCRFVTSRTSACVTSLLASACVAKTAVLGHLAEYGWTGPLMCQNSIHVAGTSLSPCCSPLDAWVGRVCLIRHFVTHRHMFRRNGSPITRSLGLRRTRANVFPRRYGDVRPWIHSSCWVKPDLPNTPRPSSPAGRLLLWHDLDSCPKHVALLVQLQSAPCLFVVDVRVVIAECNAVVRRCDASGRRKWRRHIGDLTCHHAHLPILNTHGNPLLALVLRWWRRLQSGSAHRSMTPPMASPGARWQSLLKPTLRLVDGDVDRPRAHRPSFVVVSKQHQDLNGVKVTPLLCLVAPLHSSDVTQSLSSSISAWPWCLSSSVDASSLTSHSHPERAPSIDSRVPPMTSAAMSVVVMPLFVVARLVSWC